MKIVKFYLLSSDLFKRTVAPKYSHIYSRTTFGKACRQMVRKDLIIFVSPEVASCEYINDLSIGPILDDRLKEKILKP